ncbi:hypothetical protein HK104_004811 [Borealophlyctis nickersoniae]|nr:hypothetical protein HK104_004811 [Borealophlyctis nickersoniae]
MDVLRNRKQSMPINAHSAHAAAVAAAAAASAAADETWKIVGSPPRRTSFSVPHTPERNGAVLQQSLEGDDAEDLVLSRKRGVRTRASSPPSPRTKGADDGYPPTIEVVEDQGDEGTGQGSGKWGALGMQWGNSPSIWKDNGGTTSNSSDAGEKNSNYLSPEISVTPAPRQYRSFSFSLGTMRGLEGFDDEEGYEGVTQEPLRGGDNDDDEYAAHFSLPKIRSRSKSSSAIYGLLAHQEDAYALESPTSPTSRTGEYPDINSIWSMTQNAEQGDSLRHHHEPSLLHRRASTQPSHGLMWEPIRGTQSSDGTPAMSPDGGDRYRAGRRFSHAPGLYNDYASQLVGRTPSVGPEPDFPYDMSRRRHSVAGPLYSSSSTSRYLADALEGLHLDDHQETPFLDEIDDYFENTEHRTRAWVEAGKNLQMQSSLANHFPLYVVEFKAGRTDFFYVADPSIGPIKKGDLCIVEADRGKDLGKIIVDNIQNAQQLQIYQAQHGDMLDTHGTPREVHPKRVIRLAQPTEITLLVGKSQDEAKAMSVCQSKIRMKKLPMEIVDAEYQWDRRKLTFYFVADRRIDFRELVRDLFKIYKTRIWMCAVNPGPVVKPTPLLKK